VEAIETLILLIEEVVQEALKQERLVEVLVLALVQQLISLVVGAVTHQTEALHKVVVMLEKLLEAVVEVLSVQVQVHQVLAVEAVMV